MFSIHSLLETALEETASDLLLSSASPPALRINGVLRYFSLPELSAEVLREIAYEILCCASRERMLEDLQRLGGDDADEKLKALERGVEQEVSFGVQDRARIRATLFLERGGIGACIRILPAHPPSLVNAFLPMALADSLLEAKGLVLISGASGSGKTTTLATLVEAINTSREACILCLEDTNEFRFTAKRSLIRQRTLGFDTASFATAIQFAARAGADVVAMEGNGDLERIEAALSLAETGCLVIFACNADSISASIERLMRLYPPNLRSDFLHRLSDTLLCASSQRLLPHQSGRGRIPAFETLLMIPAVRHALRQQDVRALNDLIEASDTHGMHSMERSLHTLVEKNLIAPENRVGIVDA